MKKIIPILVIFLFILSGCSAEYNLEISNDKVKENINVEILDSDIPKVDPNDEIEVNDRITPFIKNDQYPIFNDYKTKYKKKVKKVGDLTKITLNYTYSHDEFKRSNTFKRDCVVRAVRWSFNAFCPSSSASPLLIFSVSSWILRSLAESARLIAFASAIGGTTTVAGGIVPSAGTLSPSRSCILIPETACNTTSSPESAFLQIKVPSITPCPFRSSLSSVSWQRLTLPSFSFSIKARFCAWACSVGNGENIGVSF